MTLATSLGGPVSAALEADLRSPARGTASSSGSTPTATTRRSSIVSSPLAQAGELPYEVRAFRGSHLALMLSLEGVAGGADKVPLVIHLPGFNEDTVRQTPLFELYAAGTRYRKALDTLITEAAAGRVRPDRIAAFKDNAG